jgi:hypothetical protein
MTIEQLLTETFEQVIEENKRGYPANDVERVWDKTLGPLLPDSDKHVGRWRYIHRDKAGVSYNDGKIVHHKNRNHKDNSDDNLEVTTRSEHTKIDPVARKHEGCKSKKCDGKHFARGYCLKHYLRKYRRGDFNKYK